jgi:hypothetical protein
MTEIEQKALIERLRKRTNYSYLGEVYTTEPVLDADCHAAAGMLEQHLATKQELSDYKQKVSDALLEYYGGYHNASGEPLERFIIPAPKPDPLVEAMLQIGVTPNAAALRAALEARGLEIREKNDD